MAGYQEVRSKLEEKVLYLVARWRSSVMMTGTQLRSVSNSPAPPGPAHALDVRLFSKRDENV